MHLVATTISTTIILSLFSFVAPTKTVNVNLQQLTNNPSQERDAQIWNDKIVYTNFGGTQDIDVWQKDTNGGISPLIEKSGQQWAGDLHKNLLAYTDYQYSTGIYQVWLYNIDTHQDMQITFGSNSSGSPVLTDKYLYYIDGYECGSLIQYNLKHGNSKVIDTNACVPKASNNFVVWYAGANGSSNIYGYNVHRDKKFTIADGPAAQEQPAINEDTVVWYESSADGNIIQLKDLHTKKSKIIAQSLTNKYSWPSISDDYVVWGRSTSPGVAGVEGYSRKLGQVFEIQSQGSHQNSNLVTDIYKNTAVWQAWRTGNGDIYSGSFKLSK
jgi:hypothetical protein